MSDTVHVILNPASSSGSGGRLAPSLEAELARRGIPYRLDRTECPGHATVLARRAGEGGARRILAVGGDGTIHEIANGLLEADAGIGVAVAVLPVGTGNDFYRMVGAPTGIEGAVAMLEEGRPRRFDLGLARWEGGERYFVNLMGLGVDVEVLRQRESVRRLRGLVQYLAALILAVARFEPFPVRVLVDGAGTPELEEPAYLCATTVGPSAAGGFMLSPDATPDDGLLDLCFVRAVGYLKIARYIPRVIRGSHGELDDVHMRRFREIRLESPDGAPFHFQLDGELMDQPTPWLEARVVPAAFTVLVPEEGEGV